MIQKITDALWVVSYQVVNFGVQFNCKSILISLDGDLLVISPGPWNELLEEELASLGNLRWIFAPNAFHHLHFQAWQQANPGIEGWGTKALASKRPDIEFHRIWSGEQPFAPEVKVFGLQGTPKLDEVLFYHKPSCTLVVTDLIFNEHSCRGVKNWLFYSLCGLWKQTGTSRLYKMSVADKRAFRESLQEVIQLPVKRLICNHGDIIESEVNLRELLRWI